MSNSEARLLFYCNQSLILPEYSRSDQIIYRSEFFKPKVLLSSFAKKQKNSPPAGGLIEVRFSFLWDWVTLASDRCFRENNDWRLAENHPFLSTKKRWEAISYPVNSEPKISLRGFKQLYRSSFSHRWNSPSPRNTSTILGHINTTTWTASPNPAFYIDVEAASFGASLPKMKHFHGCSSMPRLSRAQRSSEILLAFGVIPFPYHVALRL